MTIRDTMKSWVINLLDLGDITDQATRNRITRLAELRNYYDGIHKQQLRVKAGKFDDNLAINLCGLITDKAVSALVGDPADGHGLSWSFPSETTKEETDDKGKKVTTSIKPPSITWLDAQWSAAHKEIFLHKNALSGAESGYPCVKLVPDGENNIRPVNLNPMTLRVKTDPQDKEHVVRYIIEYRVQENGKDVAYKEETFPANPNETAWTIETRKKVAGAEWKLEGAPVLWQYDFPPILAWQNLPCTDSPYGRSDIEGIIAIQDRYNFLVSNISKIIRLYAHPTRIARNLTQQNVDGLDTSPDAMSSWQGEGEVIQLPPVGDMPGAMLFLNSLRESAFALSREVDTLSLKDKVGAITNFALRVLYRDFLDKVSTKRMLYGAAYVELNRRMLILGGFEGEECTIQWPDVLPVNEQEETTALQADAALGLVSIQTMREKRHYDNDTEEERMKNEKQSTDDAGTLLLNNFFKTGGPGAQKKPAEGDII